MEKLASFNIGSQVLYIPIYHQLYYKKITLNIINFKNSENYYQNALSIPIFFGLKKRSKIIFISKINSVISK